MYQHIKCLSCERKHIHKERMNSSMPYCFQGRHLYISVSDLSIHNFFQLWHLHKMRPCKLTLTKTCEAQIASRCGGKSLQMTQTFWNVLSVTDIDLVAAVFKTVGVIHVTSLLVFLPFFFLIVLKPNNALGYEGLHTVLLVYKVVSRDSFLHSGPQIHLAANILFSRNQSR